MSFEVAPEALAETVAGFAVAYLLTTGERAHPHVGAVAADVVDGVVRVEGAGRTARSDIAGRGAVTLLWAPFAAGEYSLIVDGSAVVVDDHVEVTPGRAVLHRPAPAANPAAGSCGSDCVELPAGPA